MVKKLLDLIAVTLFIMHNPGYFMHNPGYLIIDTVFLILSHSFYSCLVIFPEDMHVPVFG